MISDAKLLNPSPAQIATILADHAKWLSSNGGSRAYLSGANLSWAYLSGADLSGADLSGADLSGADLSGAYLSRANLSGADLSRANLSGANLSGADLGGADLSRANLSGANLSGADLGGAYLSGANLSGAYLSGADLSGADLSRANLSGARLSQVKNGTLALAMTEILPREGEVVGWKKCQGGVLVKIRVPHGARRCNATGRKCRAELVHVIEVVGSDVGISQHNGQTRYRAGEIVKADGWDENRLNECSNGIHFFLTREEAEAY